MATIVDRMDSATGGPDIPVVKCDCGLELACFSFTNECECGKAYNFAGQELRHAAEMYSDWEIEMGYDN